MKKLIPILICLCMCSCATHKQWMNKKYPHGSRISYNENRGLMLLPNVQLGRNKAFFSKANSRKRTKPLKHYK